MVNRVAVKAWHTASGVLRLILLALGPGAIGGAGAPAVGCAPDVGVAWLAPRVGEGLGAVDGDAAPRPGCASVVLVQPVTVARTAATARTRTSRRVWVLV